MNVQIAENLVAGILLTHRDRYGGVMPPPRRIIDRCLVAARDGILIGKDPDVPLAHENIERESRRVVRDVVACINRERRF